MFAVGVMVVATVFPPVVVMRVMAPHETIAAIAVAASVVLAPAWTPAIPIEVVGKVPASRAAAVAVAIPFSAAVPMAAWPPAPTVVVIPVAIVPAVLREPVFPGKSAAIPEIFAVVVLSRSVAPFVFARPAAVVQVAR